MRCMAPFALSVFMVAGILVTVSVDLAFARDDVPESLRLRSNPETLDEGEVRYYARQYKAKCARCHALDGSGMGKNSGEQAVPPANFTDAPLMASRSDGQLYYQIFAGGGDRCAMPAFGPESDHAWDESKIWHMVAFVRRFATSPPPSP